MRLGLWGARMDNSGLGMQSRSRHSVEYYHTGIKQKVKLIAREEWSGSDEHYADNLSYGLVLIEFHDGVRAWAGKQWVKEVTL